MNQREVGVKICGLTRPQDVQAAIGAGADAVGFVFTKSPRQVSPDDALALSAEAGESAIRVGLFLDPEADWVREVIERVELDLLQFHGREDNAFCSEFGLPFIKAIPAAAGDLFVGDPAVDWPDAQGFLLDSHVPGGRGGTGKPLDWSRLPSTRKPVWLAGGLTPGNVFEAVRMVRPDFVDVSSGVESDPGVKDPVLIQQFLKAVKRAA